MLETGLGFYFFLFVMLMLFILYCLHERDIIVGGPGIPYLGPFTERLLRPRPTFSPAAAQMAAYIQPNYNIVYPADDIFEVAEAVAADDDVIEVADFVIPTEASFFYQKADRIYAEIVKPVFPYLKMEALKKQEETWKSRSNKQNKSMKRGRKSKNKSSRKERKSKRD